VTRPGSDSVTRSLRPAVAVARRGVAWRLAARVAVVVVLAGIVFGTLPYTLGAVGGDAVDTGDAPGDRAVEDPQQRYQNSVAADALGEGPWALLFVALAAAFVVGRRTPTTRRRAVGGTTVGAAGGIAGGYVALVVLAHLALAPTPNGFIVPEGPVTLQPWATVGNAVALAVPTAIGGALTATAGTLVSSDDHEPSTSAEIDDDDADVDAAGQETTDPAEADDADDRTEGSEDVQTEASTGSGAVVTGPTGAPAYDPDGRDWDGSSEDSS